MEARSTLKKRERLSSKGAVEALLKSGKYGVSGVLKFVYRRDNGLPYSRMMVSVPKKLFRRAVKRNLLKRRIREAYRLNKWLVAAGESGGTDILFIYRSKEISTQAEIVSMMVSALKSAGGNG
ncbi:MAG: ribonuclease P protein component [Candidatus Cryptobacteroides sp.]